jgi:hypothetical protein
MDQTNKTESKAQNLLTALVDLGSAWAAHGLDAGKISLENSAKVLTHTAKTLETLAREFEAKSKRAHTQEGPPAI